MAESSVKEMNILIDRLGRWVSEQSTHRAHSGLERGSTGPKRSWVSTAQLARQPSSKRGGWGQKSPQ